MRKRNVQFFTMRIENIHYRWSVSLTDKENYKELPYLCHRGRRIYNMQFVNEKNIGIDPELEDLLPPLSKEDYEMLEQSLLKNGF